MIWLFACAPHLDDAPPPLELAVGSRVASQKVDEGEPITLTVTIRNGPGWEVRPTLALPDTLSAGEPQVEQQTEGEQQLLSLTYSLVGEPDSYVIPPVTVEFEHPDGRSEQRQSTPIYVDVGVSGPRSEIGALELELPAEPARWPWVLAGFGLVSAMTLGAVLLARRRPQPALPEPIESADVEALRSWDAARAAGLDDHALALALSRIFRHYVGRVTRIPATALTSSEVLAELRELPRWEPRIDSCKRMLQATDLIKFAREDGSRQLFDDLGRELRETVLATRPWSQEGG